MAISLPKTCSMGGSQTGLVGTVGVALLNPDGTVHTARATAGIYEIGGGCYGKDISFPDNWKGSLKWDTGGGSPVYAVEEYTVDGLVDAVTEDLDDVKGTGFVKDTDSLVDIRPETDKIQAGIIDVPDNFKADVSNLDVAVSTRNATTPPTVGEIRTEMEDVGTKLTAVKDKTDNLPASPAPANEYDTEMGRIDVVLSTRSSHSAADAADAMWDEILTGASHNIPTSAGRRLRQAADALIIREETCQAGGANNEVILDAGASAVDDFYLYDIVILESGTGVGQSRHIDSYIGSSRTAIVNRDWTTNPDETTNYVLRFDSTKHVHGLEPSARQHVRDAMKLAPAVGVPTAGSVDKHLDDIEADVSGLAPAGEYDARMEAIIVDLNNPDQYKADVSALALEASVQAVLEEVLRSLGLAQENYYLDQTVYNADGHLTSGRLRTYTAAGSVGSDANVLATYLITETWTGASLNTYKVVKQ